MELTAQERTTLAGERGSAAERMALEIVVESARIMGAPRLVPIVSAHVDGTLFHGAASVLFAERLVADGGRVAVPTTTNVGSLNLLKPDQCRLTPGDAKMAFRLMVAHERVGCRPSWTCAPYQAGARPGLGDQIAWGESNAVAFANSVLGARTNRYGDFLDIACALSGRAPFYGLHTDEGRRARVVFDVSGLPGATRHADETFPLLGALIGRRAGGEVVALSGITSATEDQLKALCAGAAATGAVALIHVVGVTPEAPRLSEVVTDAHETVTVSAAMLTQVRETLGGTRDGPIGSVALGSPHFSEGECRAVLTHAAGRAFAVPVYLCIGRHTLDALSVDGVDAALTALGAVLVTDTCVVVTPILPPGSGVMMTNSAKFAHYAEGNTGHPAAFGSLADCVESAVAGHVVRTVSRS